MLIKTDAQRMGICYQELLRLRYAGHILDNPDRSNAFDLFGEIEGYYHDKRSFCMLGHVMQSRPWNVDELEAWKKRPNALIFDRCCWQDVTLRALAYVDRHLTPILEEYGTGYVYKQWRPLMNGFNEFLLELLAKMIFKECGAVYYHCVEKCCFCLDTSRALKSLRLIRR